MGASIMEKGLDSYIRAQFDLEEVDLRTYSPLTLAYIGDGIYDLIIRSLVVGKGNTRANELQKDQWNRKSPDSGQNDRTVGKRSYGFGGGRISQRTKC